MPRIAIIDITTEDPLEDFRSGFSWRNNHVRSWHSWAAATGGIYAPGRAFKKISFSSVDLVVLVAQFRQDWIKARRMAQFLRGIPSRPLIGVAFKDDQDRFLRQARPAYLKKYVEGSDAFDLFLTNNRSSIGLFSLFSDCPVEAVPVGWPIEQISELITPVEDRSGILIGTTCLNEYRRRTLPALALGIALSHKYGCNLKLVVSSGHARARRFSRLLEAGDRLEIIKGPVPYDQWMGLIATAKIVLNLDTLAAQGQVPGDALAVNVPLLGNATTRTGRLHYEALEPILSPVDSHDWTIQKVREAAECLLTSNSAYSQACKNLRTLTPEISFPQVASRLEMVIQKYRKSD